MNELLLPTPLLEACRRLSELRMEMAADADVRRARTRLQTQHHLYIDAQNEVERQEAVYQAKIKEVEEYIKSHSLEVGSSFESGGIKVKYTKGYETVSIPKAKLEEIEQNDPDLWRRIWPYLKRSTRNPRVDVG
jgi:CHAT domain-containing protein